MKVTAILRDFSASFFSGINKYSDGTVSSVKGTGFDLLDATGKWAHCLSASRTPHGGGKARIPIKIGDGSFRDQVELNQLLKMPHEITCTLAPRRGYILATFEFRKVAR